MVSETPEGGLNISFSRADLTAMPRADFHLLKLFIASIADCEEVHIVKPLRPDVSDVFEPITQP